MKLAVNSEAQVLEFKARSGSMEDVLYHYYVHYVLFHVEDLKLLFPTACAYMYRAYAMT